MSENTTVIGLPASIRAYGNEALIYFIRGEGGGLYLLAPPELTGEMLRRMDRILPYPVVVTAVVVAIAFFILRKTQFGRHTYAIGGNIEAALRAGIPVDRRIIQIYMLSAVTAGIAGFLSTLRFTAGSAVIGDPLLLSSIAAVIIGGVSLFGGAGSVMGTVIGSLIIAVLTTGLVMLNVQAFWQFIVVGVGGDRRGADRPVARPDHGARQGGAADMSEPAPLHPRAHQALRRPDRRQKRELGHFSRRGRGAARRQRRRKIDADQVHLGRLSGRRRARSSSRAGRAVSPVRSTRAARGSRRSTRTWRSPTISMSAPTSSSGAR